MSDYIRAIQDDIVSAEIRQNPEWNVRDLRDALKALRLAYRESGMPDFSVAETRLAYALAYHPFHSLMSHEVLTQARHLLPQTDNGVFTAVSLGAGPGAEVLALTKVVAESSRPPSTIKLILIDKEKDWEAFRATTLKTTAHRWFEGSIDIEHVTADLATEHGREIAFGRLSEANLIIAQALLSEIRVGHESVSLLASLVTHFGQDALLLLCDFERMSGLSNWLDELDDHETLRTVLAVHQTFPMPASVGPASHLFAHEDGLWQRRQVSVTARLYARPGWRPPKLEERTGFVPTGDQAVALAEFERFVADRTAQVFILEGPAGTGKTEIMRRMAEIASQFGVSASLHAPTGQAAVRLAKRTGLAATTIHSCLYTRSRRVINDTPDRDWPPTIEFARGAMAASANHVTLIDEASMIGDDPDVDEGQPPELRFEDGQVLSDILAGTVGVGGQLVFVGDPCQLPPYGEHASHALSKDALEVRGFTVIQRSLGTVMRTDAGSEISALTEDLRQRVIDGTTGLMPISPSGTGEITALRSNALEPFLMTQFDEGSAVALAVNNSDVKHWNQIIRRVLGRPQLLPGRADRIVTTKGSQSLGLLNGTELTVVGLEGEAVQRSVNVRDGSEVIVLTVELQGAILSLSLPSGLGLEFQAPIVVDVLGAPDKGTLKNVRRALWVDFVKRARAIGLKEGSPEFWEMYEHDVLANALIASYSYARTLFRAQGGEWDSVIVDGVSLGRRTQASPREAYSAITRTKKALYLHNWLSDRNARSEDELVDRPRSILEEALRKPVTYRLINEQNQAAYGTLSAQLSAISDSEEVIVNVFAKKDGAVSFLIQKPPSNPDTVRLLQKAFSYWAEFESVRSSADSPPAIEEKMSRIAHRLADSGVDLFIAPSGNFQAQLSVFDSHSWATFRLTYKASGEVTQLWKRKGEPGLLSLAVNSIRHEWPSVTLKD